MFETKDSGSRDEFESGMVRDKQEGKPRFDLIMPKDLAYDKQMLTRWASLMERGREKYGERNWEKATGEAELERAKASALRHMMQWLNGELDEDHAAAVMFNITEAEYVKDRMSENSPKISEGTIVRCDAVTSYPFNERCDLRAGHPRMHLHYTEAGGTVSWYGTPTADDFDC